MKILVTGAAGFIGFYTCLKLVNLGHEVIGLDNINNYYDQNLKRARKQILSHKNIKVDIVDLKSKKRLINYFKNHNFDLVVHLGAYAGVRHSMVEPEKYIMNNISSKRLKSIFSYSKHFKNVNLIFRRVFK